MTVPAPHQPIADPQDVPWLCQRCDEPTFDYVYTRAGGLCDDCYTREYLDECQLCLEHFEHDAFTRNYMAITEDETPASGDGPDFEAGIYAVRALPFVMQPLIGQGYFRRAALRFVAPLDASQYESGAAGGWVCPDCLWRYAYVPA